MRKRLLVLILVMITAVVQSWAQQRTVTGKVTSAEDGQPLPGVSVKIKGSQSGTSTGGDGTYSISAANGQVLVFTSIGTTPQDVTVGASGAVNVTLKSDAKSLNEVVVVGFGTQKKANLTGAVTTVDVAKTFPNRPLNDPAKALQGVVPGLTITQGNGGIVASPKINIRGVGSINGNSSPLIMVDNVETPDLSVINPNDIESVSVLKDAASTSIYGARAAFGVILIKTKSGKKNQPTSISYTNNFSWNKPTVMPDFADPVPELTALNNASIRAGTTSPEIFGMQLTTLRDGIANWQKNYASTNTGSEMILGQDFDYIGGRVYFFKEWDPKEVMLEKYTNEQNHSLSLRGGSEKIGYYLSAGYANENGILKMNPDQFGKYNITGSLNVSATKWLDVDAKFLYRNFKYEYPYSYQNYWYYFWRWGSYFPYGTYNGQYFRHTPAYLAQAQQANVADNYSRIDLGATFKLTKDLSIRADYTIGRDNALRHETGGPIMAWDFWSAGTPPALANIATASQDVVNYTDGRYLVNTLNAYATYQKTLAESHNLKVTAGVNTENYENINFTASRQGVLDPNYGELPLTVGNQLAVGGNASNGIPAHALGAYAGYFGRINYDYKGKYLLELNGRYDGSSAFSQDQRWGFFPSASAGYRLSEESFMQFIKPAVDDVKLRASFGSVGNQNVGGQYYLSSMSPSSSFTGTAPDRSPINWVTPTGTSVVTGISAPIPVAQSLTWEKIQTLDFGTDIRFWKNYLGMTFDWYQRDTKGMLQNASVPATFGSAGPKINAGNFRNKGWELSIDVNYPVTSKLSLYGIFTLADNKTKFTKWDNPNQLISQIDNGIYYVGQTYGEIWGFETNGFFQSADDVKNSPSQATLQNGNFVYGAGDIKYKDLNGDGVINTGKTTATDHGDLKVIGNTQPRYQYGARLGGTFKGFDLDVFVQGVGKRDYWGLGNMIIPAYQGADIFYANQLNYWTPENTNAFYPSPYIGNNSTKISNFPTSGNNFYPQTRYLLDLAYCRLKNVTFGYTIPQQLLKKYGVQKLRVYVSGQNLAEISNVGVSIDPEMTDGESGFTGRTFPFNRMYSFGLNLTF
ncbi:SusC/RagA family TonB-linked outer membrane protein [Pedobacter sp. HMF7647]|uniref:SusC/RagA family TonB-linked outer membrane protein n=1 Tax=Hufsiella arboris TaxID=2695275 RepID=A0A7K1Y592_9SPHI|nr:TonB-dependent receptor [Hufsiella arboris]MXV49531.1 SusC/RagA family TonB-linked outer membrane protein [Hufsiella arboris]